MNTANLDIVEFVLQIEDPRSRNSPHSFYEIVVTTICAAICGILEWDEIVFFATEKQEWLKDKLKVNFLNGIPSQFTFARVISSIEPNAFACDSGITLAQLEVQDKENEIAAMPKLVDYLDIKKSIITMDAMGSQKSFAEIIKSKKADYIFAIKKTRKLCIML